MSARRRDLPPPSVHVQVTVGSPYEPPYVPAAPLPAPVSAPKQPPWWTPVIAFHREHWRIIWAGFLLIAPLTSIGDPTFYNQSTSVNVLKFVALAVVCWTGGGTLLGLYFRHRLRQKTQGSTGDTDSSTPAE